MVVPGLKVFAWITWSPFLTGISRIVPVTVALTFVLVTLEPSEDPNFIIGIVECQKEYN